MEKEIDIAAFGELLIDFTEARLGKDGMKLFEQNPGGAPANLLTAASHLGCKTAFIGKVGQDMHGTFLKNTLEKEKIDTHALIEDPDYFTTLAFVAIDPSGERNFSFARKPGADTMLRKEELDKKLLSNCKIFHFGSLSLTNEPAKSSVLEAIFLAKESGALISYDPNYRSSLWSSPELAVNEMKAVIPLVDIMKVSDEESLLLTGAANYEDAADILLSLGIKFVAITLGSHGVLLARKEKKERIPAFSVKAVDTTGAGDSFWGGFLSCFLSYHQSIEEIKWDALQTCAITGNAVAALCVQKRGGIPSIPTKEAVLKFVKENK